LAGHLQGKSNPRSIHEKKLSLDDCVTEPPLAVNSIIAVRKLRNSKFSTEVMIQNTELIQ